ncbi:transferrin-binding protein-like solute binding protein [Lonepinella sp. MS14435]|uniref:transferrin-binding protein-like solute binding protein n=1 Tax=unclassified Lonepinella TaxID=2642006 RepID=UPI0036D89D0F
MQIPFKLTAILIACSFALTACSSSSSGKSTKIEENSFGVKVSTSPKKATFDKITVDGVEIDLAKATVNATQGNPRAVHPVFNTDSALGQAVARYNLNVKDSSLIVSTNDGSANANYVNKHNFEHVVVGAAKVNGEDYLFVQGAKSTDTPTTGTAYYTGGTLRFMDTNKDNLFQETGVLTGRIETTVDFGNKTITGFLRDPGRSATQQDFTGTLAGNSFTATWDDKDTGKGLEGNFYGPAATEMAGQFERSDSFGVFIAEQKTE